ncbi:MAG TPA: 8-oxoguanine deaminase [Aggregatilinea sp.]|uniref:8-oxoguanine deaminase n=1 Tax=Aggregatilinea sp. TaxID=2806333 RepID=UPI002C01A874|nr:8-oxoguanine deaminase [Aggregatilinea sp.]HML21204.1 8-oxoguanine deaminase [Aggregatilinea sp.]
MATLLVKNALVLVTMDEARREIYGGGLFIRDNVIEAVGPTAELPDTADEVLDLSGHVIIPGLVNTHHHFVQTLTRAVPSVQNKELFDWLVGLYPIWAGLTPEAITISAQVAAAELVLSGCTTASDHLYIYPNGSTLDDEIEGVQKTGLRFHASRGSMSLGESKGGLPPDRVVEDEDFILRDSRRLIETYHDNSRYSMLRITLAPCSPFTVTQDLMRVSAEMARSYPGVRLHTHLAETKPDVAFSLEQFGLMPGEYAEDVGWVGDDVWHAHCVQLTDDAIHRFGQTGTGVAHCPSSNARLASGIAPVRKMLDHHVPVGLGVDGSASNDSGHLLNEARQAMLFQRVQGDPEALTAREALEIATLGGARVLGRDDIGALKPGMAADFAAYDVRGAAFAGALHDPVAALLFCTAMNAAYTVINGRIVVREGVLETIDLPVVVERHNAIARALVNGD